MFRYALIAIALLTACPLLAASEQDSSSVHYEPATLTVWNREIVVFRAPLGNLTPQQRLDNAVKHIASVKDFDLYKEVRAETTTLGSTEARSFMLGDVFLFALTENDLKPGAGESLASLGDEILTKLEELKKAKLGQRSMPVILKGVGMSVISTLILAALVWLLFFLSKKLHSCCGRITGRLKQLKIRKLDFRPILLRLIERIIQLGVLAVALTGVYVWLGFVLAQFPYTAPWASVLSERLGALLTNMLHGALNALPGILAVVVIFVITRACARITARLFQQFEYSRDESSGIGRDAARASRRISTIIIWLFGIILAYPYIPGSESPAFKGVSVLVGLVVSLGSTGLVNQIMSGFVVLYSGAVRTGEYARMGDVEGEIIEIGLLSTKVLTPRREYVTVPNSVLISKEALNYSRMQEGDQRTELSARVTIGYDTPWRQVHSMLLLAAERSSMVHKQPEPRVLQTALSDFYIEYELRFVPTEMKAKGVILSNLHKEIVDVFNEFEVQIMSPNFVNQPDHDILTRKEDWYAAPAKRANEGDEKQSG